MEPATSAKDADRSSPRTLRLLAASAPRVPDPPPKPPPRYRRNTAVQINSKFKRVTEEDFKGIGSDAEPMVRKFLNEAKEGLVCGKSVELPGLGRLVLTYRKGSVRNHRGRKVGVIPPTYMVKLSATREVKKALQVLAASLPPELAAVQTPKSSTSLLRQSCTANSNRIPKGCRPKVDTDEALDRIEGKLYKNDTAAALTKAKAELHARKVEELKKLKALGVPPEELAGILRILKAEVRAADIEEKSPLVEELTESSRKRREEYVIAKAEIGQSGETWKALMRELPTTEAGSLRLF